MSDRDQDTTRRERVWRWQRTHWDGRQAPTSGPFLHHEAEKAKVLYGPRGEVLESSTPPTPFGFA